VAGRRRREPTWPSRIVVDAIHHDQIREHGGAPGIRDKNVLESVLARPQQKWRYGVRDVPTLAAAYGYGLVQNHPYHDGNRRIGFPAMVTFLGVNGCDVSATEEEVVTVIVAVAAGRLSEDALADWVRRHRSKRR
jgi:death-on-curing protein